MADQQYHRMMEEAYALQSEEDKLSLEDRESFQQWVKEANKEAFDRKDDPNHNAYYVASKLPPQLYKQFYAFCRTNNWSKSTAIKFAIHQLFSSSNV